MACTSCGIYQQLDTLSEIYARKAFNILAPSTAIVFGAFIALWLVWQLGFNMAMKGEFDRTSFLKTLIGFLLIQTFLGSSEYYWEYFYEPIKDSTLKLAQAVVQSSGKVTSQDINGLLEIVEKELDRVFEIQRLIKKESIFDVIPSFAGFIIVIPFVFVWGIFLAYMLEGIFKLLAITALAPLFIAAAGFSSTRSFSTAAARVVLGGCLTVVFAGIAMGFTISVLKHYMGFIPVTETGIQDVGAWLYSSNYWALFLIGFISILFHFKAATLASAISGAQDGPGAAAAVVGAGMMMIGLAKAGATSFMGGFGKTAGQGLGNLVVGGTKLAGGTAVSLTKMGFNAVKNSRYSWTGGGS